MDPFTAVATIAGFAALTLDTIKSLSNDVRAVKDAPSTIHRLNQDLDAVASALQVLKESTEGSLQHLSARAEAALAAALENCKGTCEAFQTKLRKWTRHSTEQRMHWWDRVRVGVFADKSIESLSEELLQCKATINMAISTMTLLTSAQSQKMTQDIQTILLTRENMLKQETASTDEKIAQISANLTSIEDNSEPDSKGELDDVSKQDLDAQRASLRSIRNVFQALSADVHFLRTGQRIEDIEMFKEARLLVGQFNVQDRLSNSRQVIKNVKATGQAKGVVGTAEGLDLNSFFD